MSVTAPAGFEAAGVVAGLKSTGKKDIAVVVNRGPRKTAAAVYTSNRAKANPILWSREAIKGGTAEAIVLNSGGANCFTGDFGFQTSHLTAEKAAGLLGVGAVDIQVCSTGLIGTGDEVFRGKVLAGTEQAIAELSADGGESAARAIMTTDTVAKTSVVTRDGWTIGAMAKGAGMLAPGLATTFILTFVLAFSVFPSARLVGDAMGSTRVMSLMAFRAFGEQNDYSMASTIALMMGLAEFVVVLIVLALRGTLYRGSTGGKG